MHHVSRGLVRMDMSLDGGPEAPAIPRGTPSADGSSNELTTRAPRVSPAFPRPSP